MALYRRAFLGGELATLVPGILLLTTAALGLLTIGGWLFYRLRPSFADEI